MRIQKEKCKDNLKFKNSNNVKLPKHWERAESYNTSGLDCQYPNQRVSDSVKNE